MRLRFCILFAITCGLASADSGQGPFPEAFKDLFPSPFPGKVVLPWSGNGELNLQIDPQMLLGGTPQLRLQLPDQALVLPEGTCAIPLTEWKIPKGHRYEIKVFPVEPAQGADPIAHAHVPACKH